MERVNEFLKNTSLIQYNEEEYERCKFQNISEINLERFAGKVLWLNTYGLDYDEQVRYVASQNKIDDFAIRMALDEHQRNKMIELSDSIFLSIKILDFCDGKFRSEQLLFIATHDYIWSLQEKVGDYFELIRERIKNGVGLVRKKKSEYLLFLIMEAVIDNYINVYNFFEENFKLIRDTKEVIATPEFATNIEKSKQDLFILKKAVISLRDTMNKLEKAVLFQEESHYFTELKEQADSMIDDIDFDLQQLESNLNLVFNIQNDRLNQVMKTLTVFSVVFIPLTFLAGIYGMNFKNMPELENPNGYFILLGVMFLIAIVLLWYFKKKKWF